MSLNSLSPNANVVIAGAGGGIGAEFVRQLAASRNIGHVFALRRQPTAAVVAGVEELICDLTDEDSIRYAADLVSARGPVDAVIVASGLLHKGTLQPEKSISSIDADSMLEVLRVNTIGPVLLAKHLLPLVDRRTSRKCP